MDFSIIIINFNSLRYVDSCLQCIKEQKFAGSYEIIVVNNMSTDGSLDLLAQRKDITLLDPGRNLGFSGGNNLGIAHSKGQFVLCLNFDCLLAPDFLQTIHESFLANPQVGMISGKLRKLSEFQPTSWLDSTGIDFIGLLPADRGEWEYDQGQYDDRTDIFGPSGAAAAYRREALDMVAYRGRDFFDKQMFVYCEDIDLSWRLNLAGWRGLYVPQAVAYHERGATRKGNRWKKAGYYYIGFANRYFTILKNLRLRDLGPGDLRAVWERERFFITSWCHKDPLRWGVMAYAWLRVIGLVMHPSFIPKRRLPRKHGGGGHLDLALQSDILSSRVMGIPLEPAAGHQLGPVGSPLARPLQEWPWEICGLEAMGGLGQEGGLSFKGQSERVAIDFSIPQEMSEKVKQTVLLLAMEPPGQIMLHVEVQGRRGHRGRSANLLLTGQGQNNYLIPLGKMTVQPGQENLSAWGDEWARLSLCYHNAAKGTIGISRLELLLNGGGPEVASAGCNG